MGGIAAAHPVLSQSWGGGPWGSLTVPLNHISKTVPPTIHLGRRRTPGRSPAQAPDVSLGQGCDLAQPQLGVQHQA